MIALRARSQAEAAEREARSDARRRRRRREHALIGAAAVLGFQLLFSFPTSLLDVVLTVIASAAIGSPMGFIISRAGGGMYRGGAIGAIWVAALIIVMQLLITGHITVFAALVAGLLAGGLPGALIGTHVELDR